MSSILSFQNVKKTFGNFTALEDISFSVNPGEFVALLGPNGAGKTTLINCLCGIQKRDSGNISVKGKDPEKDPEFTKTTLGIVEQEITFDPFFTCIESLKIRRGLYGKKPNDQYLEQLLKDLNLHDKKDAKGRALSGGMKRRLMIAKALAHEPEILILDEPTAGVDVELRQSLYKFLRKLSTQGLTIILTTHYLEEAENLASRIIIQQSGKTILTKGTKDLLKNAQRILEVTIKSPLLKGDLGGFLPAKNGEGYKKNFKISKDQSIPQIIAPYADQILDLKIQEPKLEDIFIKLTQQK